MDIVFKGEPGPDNSLTFVEVEDAEGHSVKFGKWVLREDGYWVIRFDTHQGLIDELAKAKNLYIMQEGGTLLWEATGLLERIKGVVSNAPK